MTTRSGDDAMTITVVPDAPCPTCGSGWPNRPTQMLPLAVVVSDDAVAGVDLVGTA